MSTEYTATKLGDTFWMVRRWEPPLSDEQLQTYKSGGVLEPYPRYVEAEIWEVRSESDAVTAAIKQGSWS